MFVFAFLVAALALLAPAAPVGATAISDIAVDGNTITFRFDDKVKGAQAFVLNAPYRLAVDFAGGVDAGDATASGGPVVRTRSGQPRAGVTRVVFDLDGPNVVRSARLAPDGRSLTLKLSDASIKEFDAAARAGRTTYGTPMALAGGGGTGPQGVTVPLDPPDPYRLPNPPIEGRRGKPLVVIDAGHGGHDPGSLSADGRYEEKDAALAMALAIRDELLKSGRVRVAMTRTTDRFLTLVDRREIPRRLDADLFISVHCDSAPGSGARGATVYTLSESSSDRVAARLAARENKADVINGVDLDKQSSAVSSILIDLTQRETMNVSSRFADLLQRELSDQGVDFKTTYHRFAGLAVLKAPDVPAVLLETGYMSNPDDLKLLFSKKYQHEVAVGVTHAVEAHFARRLAEAQVASRD
ncbi:MAG TPA: N-acetylmuramoyl-L-alanine amidase [Sphingomonas sp.]|nr:N-acetylmuramoyl-L-alanine amidase [Sphingomonas sp.]